LLSTSASAAEPQADRVYISAQEIAQRVAQADAHTQANKTGAYVPVPAEIRTLVSTGAFHGNLIERTVPTELKYMNEDYAEFYLILDGHGTMTIGGRLIDPKRTGPHLESPTLQGGDAHAVAKGDMLIVPAGVPHAVTGVQGKLVYMSMHLPLPAPSTAPGRGSLGQGGRGPHGFARR
jgi:mannose-6-phosphate isomerase-like protein (cupin superfamily)